MDISSSERLNAAISQELLLIEESFLAALAAPGNAALIAFNDRWTNLQQRISTAMNHGALNETNGRMAKLISQRIFIMAENSSSLERAAEDLESTLHQQWKPTPVSGPASSVQHSRQRCVSGGLARPTQPIPPSIVGISKPMSHSYGYPSTTLPPSSILPTPLEDPLESRPRKVSGPPRDLTEFIAARQWFLDHITDPYPSQEEKQKLIVGTTITMTSLNHWFINLRRRCGYSEISKDHAHGDRSEMKDLCERVLVRPNPMRPVPPEVRAKVIKMREIVNNQCRDSVSDWWTVVEKMMHAGTGSDTYQDEDEVDEKEIRARDRREERERRRVEKEMRRAQVKEAQRRKKLKEAEKDDLFGLDSIEQTLLALPMQQPIATSSTTSAVDSDSDCSSSDYSSDTSSDTDTSVDEANSLDEDRPAPRVAGAKRKHADVASTVHTGICHISAKHRRQPRHRKKRTSSVCTWSSPTSPIPSARALLSEEDARAAKRSRLAPLPVYVPPRANLSASPGPAESTKRKRDTQDEAARYPSPAPSKDEERPARPLKRVRTVEPSRAPSSLPAFPTPPSSAVGTSEGLNLAEMAGTMSALLGIDWTIPTISPADSPASLSDCDIDLAKILKSDASCPDIKEGYAWLTAQFDEIYPPEPDIEIEEDGVRKRVRSFSSQSEPEAAAPVEEIQWTQEQLDLLAAAMAPLPPLPTPSLGTTYSTHWDHANANPSLYKAQPLFEASPNASASSPDLNGLTANELAIREKQETLRREQAAFARRQMELHKQIMEMYEQQAQALAAL